MDCLQMMQVECKQLKMLVQVFSKEQRNQSIRIKNAEFFFNANHPFIIQT